MFYLNDKYNLFILKLFSPTLKIHSDIRTLITIVTQRIFVTPIGKRFSTTSDTLYIWFGQHVVVPQRRYLFATNDSFVQKHYLSLSLFKELS